MAVMIHEQELEVDIAEELEPYLDAFPKYKVRGNKLQACSPFREENTPSFAVNMDDGTWIDSGAYDEDWRKGNFIKLLSFLMGVTYDEARDYLLEKYRTIYSDMDSFKLDIWLPELDKPYRTVSKEELEPFMYRNPYLTNRGITEKVQRAFKIGYDRDKQAIVICWFDKNGEIINLKFRSIRDKRFWYLEDGQKIKQHIFGLHFIFKLKLKRVFAVESETDALYLWSHGIPAIAFGSASMSKQQEKLLFNSPIEELVIATDNDNAGYRFRKDLEKRLMGKLDLSLMPIPYGLKDVNDIAPNRLKEATEKVERLTPSFL